MQVSLTKECVFKPGVDLVKAGQKAIVSVLQKNAEIETTKTFFGVDFPIVDKTVYVFGITRWGAVLKELSEDSQMLAAVAAHVAQQEGLDKVGIVFYNGFKIEIQTFSCEELKTLPSYEVAGIRQTKKETDNIDNNEY